MKKVEKTKRERGLEFEDFFGKGKEIFAAVDGGAAYLAKERDAWGSS